MYAARLKGKLRLSDVKLTNPVAVGDVVVLENIDDDDSVVISSVEVRKNQIIRISPRKKHHNHIIAANVDKAFVISSIKNPKLKMGFINRVLATLEYYEIEAYLVINKMDLTDEKDEVLMDEIKTTYEPLGYPCIFVSVKTKENIELIKELTKDATSAFTGYSGVGKSSLINRLIPDADIATKEVSGYSEKGLHTTTFATMYSLPYGGYVIDTPGIKEYGLALIDAYDLSFYFPEMKQRLHNCRFNNCQHLNEPGCAVKEALDNGTIEQRRYNSYREIREELLEENKNY